MNLWSRCAGSSASPFSCSPAAPTAQRQNEPSTKQTEQSTQINSTVEQKQTESFVPGIVNRGVPAAPTAHEPLNLREFLIIPMSQRMAYHNASL